MKREVRLPENIKKSMYIRLALSPLMLAVFCLITWQMKSGNTYDFDPAVRFFAYSTRCLLTKGIFIPITFLASPVAIVGTVAILVLNPVTRRKIGIPMMVTEGIWFGWYKVLKLTIRRPRPDSSMWLVTESGFAFPSGHSMNGLLFFGMMIFLIHRYVRDGRRVKQLTAALSVLIVLVGWSRIFVGVHNVTDVLAGFSMGLACLLLSTVIIDAIYIRKGAQCGDHD